MTQEIGRCLRLGLDWRHIANILHVHRNTLLNWRKTSETATHGVFKKLREEIENAKADIIVKASQTVIEAGTTERLTKRIEKEIHDKNGNPYTQITKTYEAPCVSTALKILGKFYPQQWGENTDAEEETNDAGDKLSAAKQILKDFEENETESDDADETGT